MKVKRATQDLAYRMVQGLTVLLTLVVSQTLHAVPEVSTSGLLVEEVMAQSNDPKGFDWRRTPLEIEANTSILDEANVFQSRSYGLGLARSIRGTWLLRGGLRRVETIETPSSRHMSLSIYSQAAQPSRIEGLVGGGFFLLDGRSATPLSPKISDIGHAAIAIANVQYNHFDSEDPSPVPGMRAIRYKLIGEAGLRFQAYLPNSLGAAVEWTWSMPLTATDDDLPGWQRVGFSLSWVFGR